MARVALLLLLVLSLPPARAAKCEGRLPNFVSDICWSCMLPLSIAGRRLAGGQQQDNGSSPSGLCSCGKAPKLKVGVNLGLWEPVRLIEVTREPYCLVSLGGIKAGGGSSAPEPGARTGTASGTASYAFYHAHWYVNPLLHWLGALLDFDCIERDGFDLAYMSEFDPAWNDDELAALLVPELALTANLAGVAACAADCAAVKAGKFPSNSLWWCNGCLGNLLPMSGGVAAHVSGRHSASLLAARLAMRMHRLGAATYTHGEGAYCGRGWRSLRVHKDAYKMAQLHPRPQAKRNGRCCAPFGRDPDVVAPGGEWPVTGEDFSFMLFRKRDCCAGFDLP